MASPGRWTLIFLCVVFWSTRVLVLTQVWGTPLAHLHRWTESDMAYYVDVGERVASGDLLLESPPWPVQRWMSRIGSTDEWNAWLGARNTFYMEPFYGYFLGVWFALTGSLTMVVLANQLLSFATLLALWVVSRRLLGRWGALIAGLLYCAYGPLMMYETVALREVLIVACLTCAFLLAVAGRRPLVLGLVLGVALMVKTITILAVPFLLPWTAPTRRRDIALVIAGMVLVAGPFVVRNLAVGAPPAKFSVRAPIAFFVGNHASVRGVLPDAREMDSKAEFIRSVFKQHGADLGPMIVACIRSHDSFPHYLAFQARKLSYLFHGYEAWNNVNYSFYRDLVFPLGLSLGFLPLLLLALPGLPTLVGERRYAIPATGILLVVCAHPVLTAVLARYRQPLVPLLCLAGAAGLIRVAGWGAQRRWPPIVVVALAWVALGTVLSPPLGPTGRAADFATYERIAAELPELRTHVAYEHAKREWLREQRGRAAAEDVVHAR